MFEFDNKLRMACNHNCYYHFVERNKAIVSVFGKILGYVLRSKSILKKSLSNRRPVPSTDQALPSCFYIRIS